MGLITRKKVFEKGPKFRKKNREKQANPKYEGVGIIRSPALKVVYVSARQDVSPQVCAQTS